MPERRRQQGRKNSYSNWNHTYGEQTRRERKEQRRAERNSGIIRPPESSDMNPNPTDMEPGRNYEPK